MKSGICMTDPLRVAFRMTNRLLGIVGLRLERVVMDFDSRIDQPDLLERMFSKLADAAESWFVSQRVFKVRQSLNFVAETAGFYERYLGSPYRDRFGGSRFNNLLFLYLLAKSANPNIVIDSGTYTGASAWAFSLALPDAEIRSYDPDLSQLKLRCKRVRYVEADWTSEQQGDLSQALAYFDDHVDQAKRLLESATRGLPLAIFDDDLPVTSFAGMAHSGFALPKVEMVLDEYLRSTKQLSWISGNKRHIWPVSREYLDKARAVIDSTERLPNTSLITDIHQTPYRVVRIKARIPG
jgi:hypothetical protein